mmetsp:Transcript_52484/g.125420  ORF Transcript_52484/g.125420 Transcript_52484/m.125420 type:complete len:619 (+) Transcript_52484:89-1945(+)
MSEDGSDLVLDAPTFSDSDVEEGSVQPPLPAVAAFLLPKELPPIDGDSNGELFREGSCQTPSVWQVDIESRLPRYLEEHGTTKVHGDSGAAFLSVERFISFATQFDEGPETWPYTARAPAVGIPLSFLLDAAATDLPIPPGTAVLAGRLAADCFEAGQVTTRVEVLLSGARRVALFPPSSLSSGKQAKSSLWWQDYAKGKVTEMPAYELLQEAGQALTVPPGWWARVLYLSKSLTAVEVGIDVQRVLPLLPELQHSSPRLASRLRGLCKQEPLEELTPPPPPQVITSSDPNYYVQRIPYTELSVSTFRREYIPQRRPVIITGMSSVLTSKESMEFAVEFLQGAIPHDMDVPVKFSGHVQQTQIADFFARLRSAEDVYLADVSIPNYFPWLLQHIKVPTVFLHCFSHRTRQKNFAANNTPSLFIGAKGTLTHLHIDQLATNFWMFLAEGRKKWTCFHPDDTALLSPEWDQEEEIPRFRYLRELEADATTAESLHQARRLEFVLEEGEVLFIPSGTPHEVENVEASCAVSANFWDQSNLEASLILMERKLAKMSGARATNLLQLHHGLQELDWPDLETDLANFDREQGESASGSRLSGGLFPDHVGLETSKPLNFRKSSS